MYVLGHKSFLGALMLRVSLVHVRDHVWQNFVFFCVCVWLVVKTLAFFLKAP